MKERNTCHIRGGKTPKQGETLKISSKDRTVQIAISHGTGNFYASSCLVSSGTTYDIIIRMLECKGHGEGVKIEEKMESESQREA